MTDNDERPDVGHFQRDLDWLNREILNVSSRIAFSDNPSREDQDRLEDLEYNSRFVEAIIARRLADAGGKREGDESLEDDEASGGLEDTAETPENEDWFVRLPPLGPSELDSLDPTPSAESGTGNADATHASLADLEADWAEQRARILAELGEEGIDLDNLDSGDESTTAPPATRGRNWWVPTAITAGIALLVAGSISLFSGGGDSDATAAPTTLPPTTSPPPTVGVDPFDTPEPIDQPVVGQGSGEDDGAAEKLADSQIDDVLNGVWDAERFVAVNLISPVTDQKQQFNLEFRSNEGDDIFARFTPAEGSTSSFCIGQTPSCPDGFFPIVAQVTEAGDSIIFRFAIDAFDNSSGVTIRTFIETGPDDAPAVDNFPGTVELSDTEFDPVG
jgi:hypothetical protein